MNMPKKQPSEITHLEELSAKELLDAKKGANVSVLGDLIRFSIEYLKILNRGYAKSLFLTVPTDKIAPNYSRAITNPMAIKTIEDKAGNRLYKHLDIFLEDVRQIGFNCLTYNGVVGDIPEVSRVINTDL
jgi:hypothetical protein